MKGTQLLHGLCKSLNWLETLPWQYWEVMETLNGHILKSDRGTQPSALGTHEISGFHDSHSHHSRVLPPQAKKQWDQLNINWKSETANHLPTFFFMDWLSRKLLTITFILLERLIYSNISSLSTCRSWKLKSTMKAEIIMVVLISILHDQQNDSINLIPHKSREVYKVWSPFLSTL